MSIKDYEMMAEQLSESRAKAYDKELDVQVDGFGDEEIRRQFSDLVITEEYHLDDYREFLRTFTSAENWRNNKELPLKYVDNPLVDGNRYEGRYRQVTTRTKQAGEGSNAALIQVLRRGYEQTVLNVAKDNVDWSKARSAQGDKAYGTEEYLVVEFPNIGADHVEAVKDELDGLDVSGFNPVINNETYTTGMHRLHVTHRQQDDASHAVILFLASPEVVYTGYSNYSTYRQENIEYHDNVPKELQASIVAAWQAVGRSAHSRYNEQTKLYDIELREKAASPDTVLSKVTFRNCDRYKTTSYYWGISATDLASYIAAIPSSPGRGYTYEVRGVSNNGDGTFNLVIDIWIKNTRTYSDERIRTDVGIQVKRDEVIGSKNDDDIPSITSTSRGITKTQSIRKNDDCSKDIKTDTATVQQIDFAEQDTVNTGLLTRKETAKTGLDSDSDVTDISAATAAGEAKTLRLTRDPQNGIINETLIVDQEIPATISDSRVVENSGGRSVTETSKLNQTTVPSIGNPTTAQRLVMQVSLTANKAYNFIKKIITSKEQSISNLVVTERADFKRVLSKYQQARTAPEDLTAETGKVKNIVGLRKNDDDTFEYSVDEQTPKQQSSKRYDYSQLRNRTVEIATNQDDDATAPTTVEDGKTVSVAARPNPYGKYDKETTTVETIKRLWSRKSFDTRYGTGYITVGQYCSEDDFDTEIGKCTSSQTNSVSARHNDDGTVNFSILSMPYNSTGDATNYSSVDVTLTEYVPVSNARVKTYNRYIYTIKITYRTTRDQAYNDIDGGVRGSRVREMRSVGLWEAYKIEQLEVQDASGGNIETIP